MNRTQTLVWGVASLMFLAACGHAQKREEPSPVEDKVISVHHEDVNAVPYTSPYGDIPDEMNPSVQKWIGYYQGRGRKHMEVYLQRSTRYAPLIKKVLRAEGLPEDLIYVVFIESGFSSRAYSHASAVGYWQFIKPTARRYGLMVNQLIDERRDPQLSTEASAQYYKELYNLFGDWYLALAAYNTGENRVKRAVMKYKTREFWKLTQGRVLMRETKDYVPKFLAARAIARNPEAYGFKDIQYEPALEFDAIKVNFPISMEKLATQLNVSYEELERLNPRYRTDFVPIYKGDFSLVRVPIGYNQAAASALELSRAEKPNRALAGFEMYRVRRGDTLSTIARRNRTSVSVLRDLNELSRRSLIRVGQKLRVPEQPYAYGGAQKSKVQLAVATQEKEVVEAVSTAATAPEDTDSKTTETTEEASGDAALTKTLNDGVHVVRAGDNLSTIAKKYGTSVSDLRRLNRLGRRALLRIGQKIRYRQEEHKESGFARSKPRVHTVKKGETLIHIARRYRIPLNKLVSKNGLARRGTLLAGRRLLIPH